MENQEQEYFKLYEDAQMGAIPDTDSNSISKLNMMRRQAADIINNTARDEVDKVNFDLGMKYPAACCRDTFFAVFLSLMQVYRRPMLPDANGFDRELIIVLR